MTVQGELMLLDKFLDLLSKPLFKRTKAVSTYMTKICTLLAVALLSIEFLAASTSVANQNVFASRDDDTVTSPTQAPDAPSTPTVSGFKVNTGSSIGRGRGGDRLLEVESSSTLTFHPKGDLALSDVLIKAMDTTFATCVKESANAAGLRGEVSNINVSHMGGYTNRRINNGSRSRSRSWSLHSTGRALDISGIDVTIGGKKLSVPMTIGTYNGRNGSQDSRFYRAFTACWKKRNTNKCGSKTVLDCNHNRLHHNHVHISLPYCPRKPGIAST